MKYFLKASAIGCKPTLNNLEKKFTTNESGREPLKQRTKNSIDECLQLSPASMKDLVSFMEQKQIFTLLRQNPEGRLYGITFVDNQNKCVFNGSDLGKGYSATSLQNRLSNLKETLATKDEYKDASSSGSFVKEMIPKKQPEKINNPVSKTESLLNILLSTKEQYDNTPTGLLKKKKKKNKKNHDF